MIIRFGMLTINTANVTSTLYSDGVFVLCFNVQEGQIGAGYPGAGEWEQSKIVIRAEDGAELFNEYWNQNVVTHTIPLDEEAK